ncbi:MAG TPA: ferritin [Methanothrix sp.]|nr:ferritin [Methanothrix sp.]HNU40480.1 ferritin [Methanothrix sp.]HPM25873.1 ferritin [Methanothrix sp.]
MLSDKMNEALCQQANRELYSSYLYLSMSYYFESIRMEGFAHWMRLQAGEELVHTMKMLDYVAGSGGRARMLAVEAPQFDWGSPLQAFQHVWEHERIVTGLIHALVGVAEEEKDGATGQFLEWYVKEQVEEEESSDEVLNLVKAASEDGSALAKADKKLGERRFRFPRGFEMFPYSSMKQ